MTLIELNLDGLPGPTHYFGGLGYGNQASQANALQPSSPRRAALQSIAKIRSVLDLGGYQGILPPHPRPWRINELDTVYSSSFMWTANAATVSAAEDTPDGKIHITPANLISNLHRSVETQCTATLFEYMFSDPNRFVVHPPVVSSFPDEGAANWTRLSGGIYVAVYGRSVAAPSRLPATVVPRQSREAVDRIALSHGISNRLITLQQHPAAVEAGIFHNDVIATGTEALYLMHSDAYTLPAEDVAFIIRHRCPTARVLIFTSSDLTISDAVASYFFNSQLVRSRDRRLHLITPPACHRLPSWGSIERRLRDSGVDQLIVSDLDESLRNGGGPACVRLRIPIEDQWLSTTRVPIATHSILSRLETWVMAHYRESIAERDLFDPIFQDEASRALNGVLDILNLAEVF
ncbi:succinylarginine dihydrolase [bacterium]|nr:succinylarginine dihydrolase [bacterium]